MLERLSADLAAISDPGVSALAIGVSPWRADLVWDRLCAVRTPSLTDFSGVAVVLEHFFADLASVSNPNVDL